MRIIFHFSLFTFHFLLYLCTAFRVNDKASGCSAVGSAPGLGPGGRPFESGHPDFFCALNKSKFPLPLKKKVPAPKGKSFFSSEYFPYQSLKLMFQVSEHKFKALEHIFHGLVQHFLLGVETFSPKPKNILS